MLGAAARASVAGALGAFEEQAARAQANRNIANTFRIIMC
jgi:hypothetical protein